MKKLISVILALTLCISLSACGTKPSPNSTDKKNVLRVGASPSPHAEILEKAKEILSKDGITLEIVEFTDYILPNTALAGGDLDANFFQHQPYLDKFNKTNNTDIVSVASVHFEPLGLYPGKTQSLEDIKDGAVIAVPSDESNEARALLLLEELGLLKLKDGVGLAATKIDIVENKHNIEIFEIEAVQLLPTLPDVDFAVINGNYAVDGGILDTVLATESKEGEGCKTYANILATTKEKENDENILALAKVLNSDEIKNFILERYSDLFVPAF
ncbi:MAG: MetQ/NlpA family ABC transporter substrate-binding protein [Oscillospiraceae bacterium]